MSRRPRSVQEVLASTAAHLENLSELGLKGMSRHAIPTPLEDVRQELGNCTRCKLHSTRKNIVFGEGDPNAQLLFIGEGPGADEDETGRPFVGRAGQLLDKIIAAIEMKRSDVYICNIVKCRPPNNRAPERDESEACGPFWRRQIEAIRPRVIVTLGNVPTQTLLATTVGITKLRGRFHDYQGMQLMPTYHPAFLLRSPDMKKHTWEDMKMVRDLLKAGGQ